MKDKRYSRQQQAWDYHLTREQLGQLGRPLTPYETFLLERMGTSRLSGGEFARKALTRIRQINQADLLSLQMNGGLGRKPWPEIDPTREAVICLGTDLASGRRIYLPLAKLTQHLLIAGRTGSGKTTFFFCLLLQLLHQQIPISFTCFKNEGRRLINQQDSILVLGLENMYVNFLEPIGRPEEYYASFCAELAKAFSLRPETWPKVVPFLMRLISSRRDGDPYPALTDLEHALWTHAGEHRSYGTVAAAVQSLNRMIGHTARIRQAPSLEAYPVVVYEAQNLPPRLLQFRAGMNLTIMQAQARLGGHATGLKRVHLKEEAIFELSKDNSGGTAAMSAQVRAFTQIRSSGHAIFAGIQSPDQLDSVVKANAATFISLSLRRPADAREAAGLLRLPPEQAEQLLSLPAGIGCLGSDIYPEPLFFRYPNLDMGSYPSNEQVAAYMAPKLAALDQETIFAPEHGSQPTPISYMRTEGDETTADDARDADEADEADVESVLEGEPAEVFADLATMLRLVIEHPDYSLSQLYRSLGWGGNRGKRVKNQLVDNQLAEEVRRPQRSGGRPRILLRVTDRGHTFLSNQGGAQ